MFNIITVDERQMFGSISTVLYIGKQFEEDVIRWNEPAIENQMLDKGYIQLRVCGNEPFSDLEIRVKNPNLQRSCTIKSRGYEEYNKLCVVLLKNLEDYKNMADFNAMGYTLDFLENNTHYPDMEPSIKCKIMLYRAEFQKHMGDVLGALDTIKKLRTFSDQLAVEKNYLAKLSASQEVDITNIKYYCTLQTQKVPDPTLERKILKLGDRYNIDENLYSKDQIIDMLCNVGTLHYKNKNFKEAKSYFETAKFSEHRGRNRLVILELNAAISKQMQGDYIRALFNYVGIKPTIKKMFQYHRPEVVKNLERCISICCRAIEREDGDTTYTESNEQACDYSPLPLDNIQDPFSGSRKVSGKRAAMEATMRHFGDTDSETNEYR